MKKIFALLLVFVMIAALASCGANENQSDETVETTTVVTDGTLFTTLEAKNCFYDAGFVELISGAEEASEYTFTAENSDEVEWSVYVLDEAFDDGFRYIRQVAEPVLIGNGTISIDQGQYVYVYCSANEFTTGIVDEIAKLIVTVK